MHQKASVIETLPNLLTETHVKSCKPAYLWLIEGSPNLVTVKPYVKITQCKPAYLWSKWRLKPRFCLLLVLVSES